jgi:hypothetical protein
MNGVYGGIRESVFGVIHFGYKTLPVDVSGLRTGQYFLRVHAAGTTQVQRFSVVR